MRLLSSSAAEDCCSGIWVVVSEIKEKFAFTDDFRWSGKEYSVQTRVFFAAEFETPCGCPNLNRGLNFIPENSSEGGTGGARARTPGLPRPALVENGIDCMPIHGNDKRDIRPIRKARVR